MSANIISSFFLYLYVTVIHIYIVTIIIFTVLNVIIVIVTIFIVIIFIVIVIVFLCHGFHRHRSVRNCRLPSGSKVWLSLPLSGTTTSCVEWSVVIQIGRH